MSATVIVLLTPWGSHAPLGSECYSPLLDVTARAQESLSVL